MSSSHIARSSGSRIAETRRLCNPSGLLLSEEGKLSLDDKVAKWFPELTRAGEISVRPLLSMTSGYQDYWPQDYVLPDLQRAATAQAIMQRWAGKALDVDRARSGSSADLHIAACGNLPNPDAELFTLSYDLVGTGATAPAFSYLRTIEDGNERLVDQNSGSWNPLASWLRQIEALRAAA